MLGEIIEMYQAVMGFCQKDMFKKQNIFHNYTLYQNAVF